jgi:beta-ketoacyl-acyl-carrier-protein synthase II
MSTVTTMPLSDRDHLGRRRVVVTGIGAVTPVGLTAGDTWQGLLMGRSGISLITRFDASILPVRIAGEIKDFQPETYMDRKEVRRTSRASHLVVAAVRMAVTDARLPEPLPNPDRTGTVVGTGAGGLEVVDRELTTLRTRGFDRINPFALTGFLANMPAYHVSLITGAHGPINTVTAACASGAQAIADGLELIRSGRADLVVAAGVEGVIELTSIGAFARINALSTRNDDPEHACRPFDRQRDGTVLSEGAGALILERLDHALERNAPIYGEVLGSATSSDAFHVTAPDPQAGGMARAIRWALDDAGVAPPAIDYINAHATATPLNDSMETLAIKTVFGEDAYRIPVSGSKALLGHTLGGTGAIEAIICLLAMRDSVIPPTWNYSEPDPLCDLDYVPNQFRPAQLSTVLSNSFAMGGHNCCLVFGRIGNGTVEGPVG